MLKSVLLLVLVSVVGGIAYLAYACPCDRIPGLRLSGSEVADEVTDWSFVNGAPLCQLEVSGVLPHSINLNCMSDGPNLYLSCSRCEGKYWSGVALEQGQGRLRVAESVYPVTLSRVIKTEELDHAWSVRAQKLSKFGRGTDAPRADHWWSFRLASRD